MWLLFGVKVERSDSVLQIRLPALREKAYFRGMYLSKTPALVKPLASRFVWSLYPPEKAVYVTFDDGPTPGVTERVLDLLAQHEAKATFFCVGANVEKAPALIERLMKEGHALGSHTWNHENGWKTPVKSYLRSSLKTGERLQTVLFRPPYGRITRAQSEALKKRFFLVMWDLLSADFDPEVDTHEALKKLKRNTRSGSIIVFHDSQKAAERMFQILPAYLDFLSTEGYLCHALTPERISSQRRRNPNG